MIKHSRYKKTRKKIKGGSTVKLDEEQISDIFNKVACIFSHWCMFKTLGEEFVFSMKMLNDILLLSGLYVKNLFYL